MFSFYRKYVGDRAVDNGAQGGGGGGGGGRPVRTRITAPGAGNTD